MEGDQVEKERWKMPEEEDQEECWGFEDLEYESDGSFASPHDSISTESTFLELEIQEFDENIVVFHC